MGAEVSLDPDGAAASEAFGAGLEAEGGGDATTPPPCTSPTFPWVARFEPGALVFTGGSAMEVGLAVGSASEPDAWLAGPVLTLPESVGVHTVFARSSDCDTVTRAEITIGGSFSGPAGTEGSDAIPLDDPRIDGWAIAVTDVHYGGGVDEQWQAPGQAMGPAGTDALSSLVLGNGGSAIVELGPSAKDGEGPDFVVFENGIADGFLELAFVEVSSDGTHWARFASAYLGVEPVSAYGSHAAALIDGLAGKFRLSFGTPFDLARLRWSAEVQRGEVDLQAVRFIRIVDIVGDGNTRDSFDRPIYDPTPTFGSGGFDLDAIGVLHSPP